MSTRLGFHAAAHRGGQSDRFELSEKRYTRNRTGEPTPASAWKAESPPGFAGGDPDPPGLEIRWTGPDAGNAAVGRLS